VDIDIEDIDGDTNDNEHKAVPPPLAAAVTPAKHSQVLAFIVMCTYNNM
jgi:hypothetical protein